MSFRKVELAPSDEKSNISNDKVILAKTPSVEIPEEIIKTNDVIPVERNDMNSNINNNLIKIIEDVVKRMSNTYKSKEKTFSNKSIKIKKKIKPKKKIEWTYV